ncbi:MAG: PH domain-containing protein [Xanthomonadaceae bacterium]|nr:PH domain-containing protein [Xanthomonadaceae bacterium]
MNDALPPLPPTPATPLSIVHPDVWQPLPARGRALFRLGHATWLGLTGAGVGTGIGVLAHGVFDTPIWIGPVTGLLLGALYGAWLGGRRHGYYRWKLDDEGFAVRKGRMWQSETHVPATRVQHLDVKRGPLERSRSLATLLIHTAGTRLESIRVPCLDDGDAEALRSTLAARTEPERDDD